MPAFRAIVSIEFSGDDLQEYAELLGVDELDPLDAITMELDNLGLGTGYAEQIFKNGNETLSRMMAGGIEVTINDHDLEFEVELELEDDDESDVDDEY